MAAWTAADRRPVPELPGDHVVRDAQLVVTRSATIDAPPDRIWPWLVQVGWHRGGWYTARWVDRLLFPANRPSAKEILPEHQHLAVGDFVPDGPPETGCGFVVEELVPGRHLVLHSTSHLPRRLREAGVAAVDWTWSFNLLPLAGEATRLVFRWRARCTPWWLAAAARLLVVPADTFMSRSMLRGIRSRVEGGTAVERLSAQDLSMLWPDDLGWPQDIGAIGILDGGSLVEGTGRVRVDEARRAIACRLPMLPRFRQVVHVPRLGQGRRLWVDAPDVDLEWHVRVADLLDGEAGLLPAVERIRRQPLDRARPLWQVWFLSGLAGGRVGCFIRVHHAITDGVGGVSTLATLFGATSGLGRPPAPVPAARTLFLDNMRGYAATPARAAAAVVHPRRTARALRASWPALREMIGEKAPLTSLNRPLGPRRTFTVVRGRLDAVKETAHAHGGTVNDVLLAAIAGGLRDLLRARGEAVDGVALRAYVPVALHRERTQGNEDAMMLVPLPVGIDDPADRLRSIAADTVARRGLHRLPGGELLGSGLLQRTVLPLMARQRWANTYVANVPGSPAPLTFAGAPLLELFPLVPLIGNVTLGVGALSYAGQFNLTVVADADACPDVATFADGLRRDLTSFARASRGGPP